MTTNYLMKIAMPYVKNYHQLANDAKLTSAKIGQIYRSILEQLAGEEAHNVVIEIDDSEYSVMYDPTISIFYDKELLKKRLGGKFLSISRKVCINGKQVEYVSRKLVQNEILSHHLNTSDFLNAFKKIERPYIEITRVGFISDLKAEPKQRSGRNVPDTAESNLCSNQMCCRCHEPISKGRLEAIPTTHFCVHCAPKPPKPKMETNGIAGTKKDTYKFRSRSLDDR